ncbi:MAG TPA: hypothetical protein VG938_02660 [Verrucomicrobiae bacterium]|nr:hypothetical protein [Verrucomicrobiae bacterium]
MIWLVSIAVTCWLGYYCLEGNDWYSRHDHLGNLLRAGMTTNDVMAVLGPPEIQMSVTGGDRWSYSDQGPTSGAGCVVDFAPEGGVLRLRYFLNYQHLLFRDGLHREFGSPVDGGSFKDDPFLKLRWDEWHGKKLDR